MVNPYRAPPSDPPKVAQPWTARRISLVACWWYPLVLIVGFYSTWAMAGAVLGQAPRPGVDPPDEIHVSVTLAGWICTAWLVMFPVFAIYGAMGELFPYSEYPPRPLWRLLRLLLFGLIWSVCFGFLRWDPHGVVRWFMAT